MASKPALSIINILVKAYKTEELLPALSSVNHGTLATPTATGRIYRNNLLKRNKSNKIDLKGTTADQLTLLDSFKTVDYDSFEKEIKQVSTIGVKYHVNDDFNISLQKGAYDHLLKQSIDNQKVTRTEEIIAELIKGKTNSNINVSWDTISNDLTKLSVLVDDYSDGTDRSDLLVIGSPFAGDLLAKEKGTIFRGETPVFNSGIKVKENINGVPFIRCNAINKFSVGAGAAARPIAYIAFRKQDLVVQFENAGEINQQLGLYNFKGLAWYDLIHRLVDNRVIVRTFNTAPGSISKKAND